MTWALDHSINQAQPRPPTIDISTATTTTTALNPPLRLAPAVPTTPVTSYLQSINWRYGHGIPSTDLLTVSEIVFLPQPQHSHIYQEARLIANVPPLDPFNQPSLNRLNLKSYASDRRHSFTHDLQRTHYWKLNVMITDRYLAPALGASSTEISSQTTSSQEMGGTVAGRSTSSTPVWPRSTAIQRPISTSRTGRTRIGAGLDNKHAMATGAPSTGDGVECFERFDTMSSFHVVGT
ncbi:hypothetical protein RhiJN_27852 [Ceratobasidium sp. AG-Ba]|nr:hypothetical protein RhiJN_27852 [Ceratobasidium sp. AG-Ba]